LVVLAYLFARAAAFTFVDILGRVLNLTFFPAYRNHPIRALVCHALPTADGLVVAAILLRPMPLLLEASLPLFTGFLFPSCHDKTPPTTTATGTPV
jgi:hypothetical protein